MNEGCFVCCSLTGACFAFPRIPWILAANPRWGCRFNIPALPAQPVVIRGAFYDGESSFPSKIDKSPRAFGIFIWASKSHFISPSVADPPSTPAFLVFPGFLVALCAGHRGWSCSYPCLLGNDVEKISPFPSGYKAGEMGMCFMSPVLLNLLFITWVTTKNSPLFPHKKQKYKFICDFVGSFDFSSKWLAQKDIFGNADVCCYLQDWRIQVPQLGRAKLLKITKSAAWQKLFLVQGVHCRVFTCFKSHSWTIVLHEVPFPLFICIFWWIQ